MKRPEAFDTSRVLVHFTISGESLDPDEVTRRLGLEPSKIWRRGSIISGTVMHHKLSGWRLDSGLPATAGLEEQVRAVLERLRPSLPAVKGLVDAALEIGCVVYVNDGVPAMHFDLETLKQIVECGGEVDIDLYCLKDNGKEGTEPVLK